MAEAHEPTDTTETSERRTSDPELLVIGRILRHLGELEPVARKRAVAYLADRFALEE